MNTAIWNDLAARDELTTLWPQLHDLALPLVLGLPLLLALIFLAGLFRAKLLCKA